MGGGLVLRAILVESARQFVTDDVQGSPCHMIEDGAGVHSLRSFSGSPPMRSSSRCISMSASASLGQMLCIARLKSSLVNELTLRLAIDATADPLKCAHHVRKLKPRLLLGSLGSWRELLDQFESN